MIVRTLQNIENSTRDVRSDTFISRCLVAKEVHQEDGYYPLLTFNEDAK